MKRMSALASNQPLWRHDGPDWHRGRTERRQQRAAVCNLHRDLQLLMLHRNVIL